MAAVIGVHGSDAQKTFQQFPSWSLELGIWCLRRYPLIVLQENFSNAALVLLGHGSTKNADSSAPVFQHAAELRGRKIFAEVREAFWKQEPQVKNVLTEVTAPRVFIVPLFISEGYFSAVEFTK